MANYDLSTYVFTNAQPQQLPTTTDNHSGVAYSPTRNSLYTVINNPTQIIEYNLAGTQVIRTINLIGFDDTEAIFHLGNEEYAVVEEKKWEIVRFTIGPSTTSITKPSSGSSSIVVMNPRPRQPNLDNSGIEGVSYDPQANVYY